MVHVSENCHVLTFQSNIHDLGYAALSDKL